MLLISGCGPASPETRVWQTRTALRDSLTPTPISQRAIATVEQERAQMLTAEAFLPVAARPIVVGAIAATPGPMTEPELTEETIEAAMAKAEARVCVGSDPCYALANTLDVARTRCTPKGRCRVGLLVSHGGREAYDVWLEVSTGLVKLIRQAEPGT